MTELEVSQKNSKRENTVGHDSSDINSNNNNKERLQNLENLLLKFCVDCDERVRIASSESLVLFFDYFSAFLGTYLYIFLNLKLKLMKHFGDLGSAIYAKLFDLLDDLCPTVRMNGLNLVHQMAEIYPEL